MALPMVPYADAGPLYGLVFPTLISVAVTPTTVWAAASAGISPARATARTAASSFVLRVIRVLRLRRGVGMRGSGIPSLLDNTRTGHPDPDAPDSPGDAEGHHVHEHDEEDAEDGPGRCLGDVLGPVGHELDEERPEDGTGDRRQATD